MSNTSSSPSAGNTDAQQAQQKQNQPSQPSQPSQPKSNNRRRGPRSKKPASSTSGAESKSLESTVSIDLANTCTIEQSPPSADQDKREQDPDPQEEEDEDAEYCFICTDKIEIAAIFPCNHVTCHNCTLKLRGLMNNKHCTQCRTDRENVIISKKVDRKYQDFKAADITYTHEKLGISFDDRATQDEVLGLLRFNCPDKGCPVISGSWKELKRHTQESHHLRFCELCIRHKKLFTGEFEIYNARDLSKHEREGDNKGFKGHPRCQFCNTRFYSGDELFIHLRDQHEKCHICNQQNPNKPQYFSDYTTLETHFRSDHYACMVQSCIDNKFVVFRDEIDWRAHMVEVHPNLYGNSKTARTLDIDFGFNKGFQSKLSTVSADTAGGSNGNNKGKNKKAPNANNNNNNNNNNSNSNNNSNGQGSSSAAPPPLSNGGDAFPQLGSKPRIQFSALSPSFGQPSNISNTRAKESPADLAKRRLEDRVRNALNYDAGKFSQFGSINQRYLSSQIEATTLITEYQRLFSGMDADEMEVLVHDFTKANISATGRVKALNKAWEDHRMKSQFPTLGPRDIRQRPVGSGAWASQNGGKKYRNEGSSNGAESSAFPSLPPAPKTRFPPVSAPVSRPTTPSVNFSSISVNGNGTATRKVLPGGNQGAPVRTMSSPSLASDEFPALPVAKPKKKFPTAHKPRVVEPHHDVGTILTPPRNLDEFAYLDESGSSAGGSNGSTGNNRKGKGKKKTLLYHIGV